MLKWLSCSLVVLSVYACKKFKGPLDDFKPGIFNYTLIWKNNNIYDTLTGEVFGPYNYYIFKVRKTLQNTNSTFNIQPSSGDYPASFFSPTPPLYIDAPISYMEHDENHLWILLREKDEYLGKFELTRKE